MKTKVEELLSSNCVLIFDTNVYLNLYDYSPHIANFFIDIISIANIQNNIYMPSTVKREFDKNHKKCWGRQNKKFKNVPQQLKKLTIQAQDKIYKQLNVLEKFQFPGIDGLKTMCKTKIDEINNTFQEYEKEHDAFEKINEVFLKQDKVVEIVKDICDGGRLLPLVTIEQIYSICEDGKNRYSKNIPPGFKDAKDKDGVEKYNDLLIWNETIKFCKNEKRDLIFVVDDVKKDWWTQDSEGKNVFHEYLVKEFKDLTDLQIIGITSYELYTALADIFGMPIPDAVESVLKFSTEDYIKELVESDDFRDALSDELIYSGELYVDTDSLSGYDGSYFEIEEVIDINLINFELEEYKNNEAIYDLMLNVKVNGRSRKYADYDNEIEKAFLSDDFINKIEGRISVRIVRTAETYRDDLLDDISFDEMSINHGDLEQIGAYLSGEFCKQCGRRIGEEEQENSDLVCTDCASTDTEGDSCPECGKERLDGFCEECSDNIDF